MTAPGSAGAGGASENPILAAALAAHRAGICVLPPREDGTKAPNAKSWTELNEESPDALENWKRIRGRRRAKRCG